MNQKQKMKMQQRRPGGEFAKLICATAKTLWTWFLPISNRTCDVFYMRQMWVCSMGIHDCINDQGHMFTFGDDVAKKDLNAGSSYLQTYFKENRGKFPFKCQAPVKSTFCYRFYFNFPTDYAWATVYSDGCWTKQKPNCVLVSGSHAVEWDIWCHQSQIPGKPFPWYIIKVQ